MDLALCPAPPSLWQTTEQMRSAGDGGDLGICVWRGRGVLRKQPSSLFPLYTLILIGCRHYPPCFVFGMYAFILLHYAWPFWSVFDPSLCSNEPWNIMQFHCICLHEFCFQIEIYNNNSYHLLSIYWCARYRGKLFTYIISLRGPGLGVYGLTNHC